MYYDVQGSFGPVNADNKKIIDRFEFTFAIEGDDPEFNKKYRNDVLKAIDSTIDKIKSEISKDHTIAFEPGAVTLARSSTCIEASQAWISALFNCPDVPCNPIPRIHIELTSLDGLEKFRKTILDAISIEDIFAQENSTPIPQEMERGAGQPLLDKKAKPARNKNLFC